MTITHHEAAAAVLREWLERQPLAFKVVEDTTGPAARVRLVESHSRKSLSFAWGQVERVEDARSSAAGTRYLRVRLDDGRSFALAGLGLVFAPVFTSTGPLAECPPTASFRDFDKLFGHLSHLVIDHHEGHEQEALQVFLVLLSFLDGARALGIDVSDEERRLEPILRRLEEFGLGV